MVSISSFLERIKERIRLGIAKSQEISKEKEPLVAEISKLIASIKPKLAGCDLGKTIPEIAAKIDSLKPRLSYGQFPSYINPFIKAHGFLRKKRLSKKELDLIWILHERNFKKFHQHKLSKLFFLLQREANFMLQVTSFFNKLPDRLDYLYHRSDIPFQKRAISRFSQFIRSIKPMLAHHQTLVQQEQTHLQQNIDDFIADYETEKTHRDEIYKHLSSYFSIPHTAGKRRMAAAALIFAACASFLSACEPHTPPKVDIKHTPENAFVIDYKAYIDSVCQRIERHPTLSKSDKYDMISLYREIDMDNLSEQEKKFIREYDFNKHFNPKHMESKYIGFFKSLGINLKNPNDVDKVFMFRIISAVVDSLMGGNM